MTTHFAAMRRRVTALIAFTMAAAALLMAGNPAGAAIVPTVLLHTAVNYAVLGHSTVTNTGPTVVNNGSVGLSPGTSITNFPPGIVVPPGTLDATSAAAHQGQLDVTTAYNDAAGRSVSATTNAELGGLVLPGGVYAANLHHSLGLTGTLTLDGANNPDSVFIFQTDSTLTTASRSRVQLVRGAQACNVFWQVGSSATLGTSSNFSGNIFALASVTVTTGVVVHGRAFARTGAVTLDTDVFTEAACALAAPTTTTAAGGGTPTTAAGPGGGTATTVPGGPSATLPGGAPVPTLPGTPPGRPGVPGVTGPPRTGGSPLRSSTVPWFTLLFGGLFGTAALGGVLQRRRAHARRVLVSTISTNAASSRASRR
jgi:hypothetical protein